MCTISISIGIFTANPVLFIMGSQRQLVVSPIPEESRNGSHVSHKVPHSFGDFPTQTNSTAGFVLAWGNDQTVMDTGLTGPESNTLTEE